MSKQQPQFNYGTAFIDFPRREKKSTNYFSKYRRFFRGTKWELLAIPAKYNMADRDNLESIIQTNQNKLLAIPAVYELAVSAGYGKKKYKVYLGKTDDMVRRGNEYAGPINYLKEFISKGKGKRLRNLKDFKNPNISKDPEDPRLCDNVHGYINAALIDGLFVLRRIRYIKPRETKDNLELTKSNWLSGLWETRFLSKYNYAWNHANNGQLDGKKNGGLINHRRFVQKENFCCFFYRIKFVFADDRAKQVYKF